MYQIYKAAWPWATQKVQKGCIKINIKIGRNSDVTKYLQSYNMVHFWGVIAFTRSFDLGLYLKFKKVTQRSTSNLAEILIRRTSLPIMLQHDAGNFWSIMIFTRSFKMLELTCSQGNLALRKFESSKRLNKGQHRTHSRYWCEEYYYQVTTWYRQFMKSYHVHTVLPDTACLKV